MWQGGVFGSPVVHRHAQRHVRIHHRHIEVLEQSAEIRIVGGVENDKPGVDRHLAFGALDVDGIRVSAEPGIPLIEHHLVVAAQQPSRRQSGDAAPTTAIRRPPAAPSAICRTLFPAACPARDYVGNGWIVSAGRQNHTLRNG